jgi:hypothetical protein
MTIDEHGEITIDRPFDIATQAASIIHFRLPILLHML